MDVYTDGSNIIRIKKLTGFQSDSTLGADISYTPSINDVWKIDIVGSTITVYVNGSSVGTRTDSAYASGSAGVITYGDNVGNMDNWEGGNVGGGGGGGGGCVGKCSIIFEGDGLD